MHKLLCKLKETALAGQPCHHASEQSDKRVMHETHPELISHSNPREGKLKPLWMKWKIRQGSYTKCEETVVTALQTML